MAGAYDLLIDQGSTFQMSFLWKDASGTPVDLTGYTAKADLRDWQGNLLVSLTTANGDIALGGTAGTLQFTLPAAVTQGLLPGTGQWDLFLTSAAGVVTRLLAGNVVVQPRVTQ